MTPSDLVRLLAETNLALAAGVIVVVAARKGVRRLFGAAAAYGLWLLPALAAVAVSLPPRTVESPGPLLEASPGPIAALGELPAPALQGLALTPGADLATMVLWGWIAGAVAMGLWLAARQLQFMREVARGRAGPAVVGFLRPRIVLPAHFEIRFTRRERRVVLAHERTHLLRGDAQVNGAVALVRCLCWFNPMAHLGAHLMRVDQELACDASVIARYPKSRAPYAQALLKAELAARPLPLGCYWPARSAHPLTERMAILQRDPLPRHRRLAGAAFVAALATVAGTAAWAARPPEVVAAMGAHRSVAALPQPAGARGPEPIERSTPVPSAPVQAPLPGVVVTSPLQAPTKVAPEELAQVARPSADLDEEGRTQSRVPVPAATPSPTQPQERVSRPLLLASLQPTIKSASLPRPPPSTADLPSWSQTPTAAEMQAAYPPAAARANYASSATLECTVAADGGLTDCRVAKEGAPGFGAAALSVAPKFRLPTTSPSGAPIVGRTVRPRIGWVNPSNATATLTIRDEGGPVGIVAFNCRVRAHGSLDNCVVVDANPRGRAAFAVTGEVALRFRAPAGAAEFSRIRVIVAVVPNRLAVTNALTCSNDNCGGPPR